jgi:hypothetical protein
MTNQPGQTIAPQNKWRPEIIATVAAGIGALASAVIAAITLSFLSSQEKATYLSNLYNKQVDTLAGVETAAFEFMNLVYADHLIRPTRAEIGDLAEFQKKLIARNGEYQKADYKITTARLSLALVAPKALDQAIGLPETTASNIIEAIREFEKASPTEETLNHLLQKVRESEAIVNDWDETVLACLEEYLPEGMPLDNGRIDKCHMAGGKHRPEPSPLFREEDKVK